eukprot:TRINITY_DN5132_c0_g1_i1.p1 TRINITY_DN5132_c0_g1~~TRINITY_DN5132_c0_g1_i1.p1  ORF type:complete len:225 (+),score=58.01 TRINITY_DN5132_c0_g1_i1:65-739(+)
MVRAASTPKPLPLEQAWVVVHGASAARPRSDAVSPRDDSPVQRPCDDDADDAASEGSLSTALGTTVGSLQHAMVFTEKGPPAVRILRRAARCGQGKIIVPEYRLMDIVSKRVEYLVVLPRGAVTPGEHHMAFRRYSHFRALHEHYRRRLRPFAALLASKFPAKSYMKRRTLDSFFLTERQRQLEGYLQVLVEAVTLHLGEGEWGAMTEFLCLPTRQSSTYREWH